MPACAQRSSLSGVSPLTPTAPMMAPSRQISRPPGRAMNLPPEMFAMDATMVARHLVPSDREEVGGDFGRLGDVPV